MKDFLKAATPWILTGLGIALCAVRGARGRRGGEEGARDYTGELCAGVCLGAAAGFLAAPGALALFRRDNAEAAYALETEYGILTRCGLHCAPSAHRTLGTFPQGTVRFSLGFASTEADVDAALHAIRALG